MQQGFENKHEVIDSLELLGLGKSQAAQQYDTSEDALECHLKHSTENIDCNFWLGIYSNGKLDAKDIINSESTDIALKKASEEGLRGSDPILFSNCESGETVYTLLVPENNSEPLESWLSEVYKSINSISPKMIGLYFGKKQLDRDGLKKTIELFLNLARIGEGKSQGLFSKVYIMTAGHSFKNILNVMFEIKKDFMEQGFNIKVFH